MNDVGMIVRVIERVTKLTRPFTQFFGLEDFARLIRAQIRKRVAVNIFHRDAARRLIVYEIVNADDVLVRELKAAPRLVFKLAEHRTVVND